MNYATPRSSWDTGGYRQAASGLPIRSQEIFDIAPEAAYEWYLSHFKPDMSFGSDQAMRRLYNQFRTRYESDIASGGKETSGLRWTDWLGSLDPQREMARMPRSQRYDDPSRFNRASRYIAF